MYAPSPPPEGALAGVGVKKVPNNLNNNSQLLISHDKMTLKPSKIEKRVNKCFSRFARLRDFKIIRDRE